MPPTRRNRVSVSTFLPRWARAALFPMAALAAVLLAGCVSSRDVGPAGPVASGAPVLEYLGAAHLASGTRVDGELLGGLSALTWDGERGEWLALSDDRAEHGPVRVFTLKVSLDAAGRLADGGVEVTGVTALSDADGSPFATGSVDPEGLALTAGGTLLFSSEGVAKAGEAPFVREMDRDGSFRRAFEVPPAFLPRTGAGVGASAHGVRDNQGFESLALSPDGGSLFTAAEGPLLQDGPEPVLGRGAFARLLRFDAVSGRPLAQVLYPLDPLPVPAASPDRGVPDGFEVNGLVELLSLGGDDLLALERAYVGGRGYFLRLYRVSLTDGDDVSALDALPSARDREREGAAAPRPVAKHLLLDLADLADEGVDLYNTEGMALGPRLADGRRLLLFVSDDNFAPDVPTQLLAFAVDPRRLAVAPPPAARPATVAAVQGAAHLSPLAGARVTVEGVVTALAGDGGGPPGAGHGYWIQDPRGDGDPATSEGVFVALAATPAGVYATDSPPPPRPGDRVRVIGRAMELGRRGGLTVTTVAVAAELGAPDASVTVLERGLGVPPPIAVGGGAPCPPGPGFDDDGLSRFEPASDGLDFWESLEGMRLAVAAPTVVGPTSRYGDLVVVAEGCAAAPRTVHRGLLARAGDFNPERLTVAGRRAADAAPPVPVGTRFAAALDGVLSYDFDNYRLLPAAWPALLAGPATAERTTVVGGDGWLTVATFNVENFSARDGDAKLAGLAAAIVDGLASPALVALQEVQDDSGAADDGTVSAAATLDRLVAAVAAAGGPRYEHRSVDPEDGADGGRPGGNIRVALLYDPARVQFVDRPAEAMDPGAGARVETAADGPHLVPSPGRLAPGNAAFERSRKPLVAELRVAGRPLYAVVLHLGSKGGDDPLAGAVQPPRLLSEAKRSEQARLVADLVAQILSADPRARVLVLGDLNELPWRAPLARLADAGLVNLVQRLPSADRYTFVYQGNSQVLDHVLVSPALADAFAGIDAVHRHADFPAADRASDHDPVVARFRLP